MFQRHFLEFFKVAKGCHLLLEIMEGVLCSSILCSSKVFISSR